MSAADVKLPGAVYWAGTDAESPAGVDAEPPGRADVHQGPLPAALEPLERSSVPERRSAGAAGGGGQLPVEGAGSAERGAPAAARYRRASSSLEDVVRVKQRSHTSFQKARAHPRLSRDLLAGPGGTRAATRQWLSSDHSDDEMSTTATHGQLSFQHGREVLNPAAGSLEEARQARFMRVECDSKKFEDLSPAEQVERVTLFKGLVDFMQQAWKMEMPSVIFSVTGSAEEFTLRPKFRDTFMSALLNATRSTNAWIVTGGSDSGIMKLVGDTLARGKQMETALAIASWGTVHGRTELIPSECKAQEELKRSMPSCTIRIDTDDSRVYTEEKLNEVLSRYGTVVGVSLSKSSGYLKRLLTRAIATHKNLHNVADTQGSASKFAFVTFRDPSSAENAVRNPVLKLRLSKSDPVPAVLHCRLLENEGQRPVDERQVYRDHEAKVLGRRGGPYVPFVYDGKRGANEQEAGARLNPNHSHYLLVDTGNTEFAQEIIFRSELLDFISFRHDAKKSRTQADLDDLTSAIRGRSKDDKRSVPVVAFVYGGGPGTLTTILEHVRTCDPVIIVVGSGRAADLICEWKSFRDEMETYSRRVGDPNHLMVRLNNKKVGDRQSSRLRAWLLSLPQAQIPTTEDEELELQGKVDKLSLQLDNICKFELIYFFDFQQKLDPTVKIIKDSLLARQGSNPHLLSIVLKAIFRSPNVRDIVKLPLAVRYGDRYQVKQLMKKQGIQQGAAGNELTSDARPMVYAAFHDDFNTVSELLKHGTDVRCLDHLILAELCAMLKHRQILKSTHLEPPLSWLQEEVSRHLSLHRNEWMALSPDEQQQICKAQWATRSLQEQQKICSEDVALVSWGDLPYLRGYEYKVLGSMAVTDPDSSGSGSNAHVGARPPNGALFRQAAARHTSQLLEGDAGIEIDLISCEVPSGRAEAEKLTGRVVSVADAQQFAADLVDAFATKDRDEEVVSLEDIRWDYGGVWVIVETNSEQSPMRVLLQQHTQDEITRCLVLNHPSRWLLSKMTPGSISRATEAFRPWLPAAIWADGGGVDKWFEMHDSSCEHSWLSSQLHPLHRLYWAIQTNREELTQLFWRQSDQPIIASFLASYTYRHTEVYAKSHKKKRAFEYDSKAEGLLEILNNVPELAAGQQMHVLMDEYVYFPEGEDIEQIIAGSEHGTVTQYGMLTDAEKKCNKKIRSALALMGADPTLAMTALDLAIRAENKLFMAHRATQDFLDTMWTTSMGNGQWLDTILNTSPRTKFRLASIGYTAAIILLWAVFIQMPTANEMQWPKSSEWLLWIWWFGSMVNEAFEYGDSRSLRAYLAGSGNKLDILVIFCLFLALCCRIAAAVMAGNVAAVWVYRGMMMLLMLGVFAQAFRLIHMFSFSRRLGIIKIILVRIVDRDVVPFLLYLTITLCSFEVANTLFGWLHDVQLEDRAWGYSLFAFSESINVIRLAATVDTVEFEASIGGQQASIPVTLMRESFNLVFFVVTVVILMNVLIAMMANTFSVVIEQAEEEWRLIFAGMVREYFDSNVLPPPLNLLELPVNQCMSSKMEAKRSMYHADGHKMPRWGQHYLFPVPSLRWHLPMAMASFLAAGKDQGSRGIKHIIGKLDQLAAPAVQMQQISMGSGASSGVQDSRGSSSGLQSGGSDLSSRQALALKHDLLAELQPIRQESERASSAIGHLAGEVANLDQKLSAVLELLKETTLHSGTAIGGGGAAAKPDWQISLEQEVAATDAQLATGDDDLRHEPTPDETGAHGSIEGDGD